jgi:hypothetical protein
VSEKKKGRKEKEERMGRRSRQRKRRWSTRIGREERRRN